MPLLKYVNRVDVCESVKDMITTQELEFKIFQTRLLLNRHKLYRLAPSNASNNLLCCYKNEKSDWSFLFPDCITKDAETGGGGTSGGGCPLCQGEQEGQKVPLTF